MSEKLFHSHESFMYTYAKKSSAYHKLSNEFCGICDHQHRSARKQRSNLSKKDCCPKQQRLCLLFVQTRTRKHKKSGHVPGHVFILMNMV